MLDQLRGFLDHPDRNDDAFVSLHSLVLNERDATLTLRVLDPDGREGWRTWEVRALGLRDSMLRQPHGDLSLHTSHVLAQQHTDPQVDLSFRGKSRCAVELVGRLYLAHRALVKEWIPAERYLHRQQSLVDLLDGGYGKLADGPQFLMAAYAAVLEASGVTPRLLPPHPPMWWDGTKWVEQEGKLFTLLMGDSYFVATRFEETPG